jgi:hypothetical protein
MLVYLAKHCRSHLVSGEVVLKLLPMFRILEDRRPVLDTCFESQARVDLKRCIVPVAHKQFRVGIVWWARRELKLLDIDCVRNAVESDDSLNVSQACCRACTHMSC